MTTAIEMHEAQRQADIAHHRERLVWLSSANPVFSDGEPVGSGLAFRLKAQSRAYLANPIMADYSCHCDPPCA